MELGGAAQYLRWYKASGGTITDFYRDDTYKVHLAVQGLRCSTHLKISDTSVDVLYTYGPRLDIRRWYGVLGTAPCQDLKSYYLTGGMPPSITTHSCFDSDARLNYFIFFVAAGALL
jgi:hypothetical protein